MQLSLHALGLDLTAVGERGCSTTQGLARIAVAARGSARAVTVAPRRGLRADISGENVPDWDWHPMLEVEVARERPEQVLAVGDEHRPEFAAINRPPWTGDAQTNTDIAKIMCNLRTTLAEKS